MPQDANSLKGKTGLTRLLNALRYSMQGFACVWKTEEAFRQEVLVCAPGVVVALLLPIALPHRALLAAGCLLVLIVELINSAIEAAIDRQGSEIHPLAKKAKDAGSAAVLLALVLCALLWTCVLAVDLL